MDKTALILLLFIVLLGKHMAGSKLCHTSSDCVDGKRCCEKICVSRKSCNGLCSSESDCDKDYGESCAQGKCQCVQLPCTQETIHEYPNKECNDDSQCYKNETCKDGVCQTLKSLNKSKGMNPAVLGVVATVALIIFVGAFYLCLRKQRSSRPSLAAKVAHNQAMKRIRTKNEQNAVQPSAEEIRRDLRQKEHHYTGKKQSDSKDPRKKTPITSPSSLIELSAIIEEDEMSENAS